MDGATLEGRAILSIIDSGLRIRMINAVPGRESVRQGSHIMNRTTLAFGDLMRDLRAEGRKSDVGAVE